MRRKVIYLVLLLISFTLVVFYGCKPKPKPTAQVKEYPICTIKPDSAYDFIEFIGDMKGEQDVEIDAKITGYITQICVKEGDFVKTGQTLFLIDDDDYQYNVTKAKAQIASANAELERAKLEEARIIPLVKINAISQQELESAQATTKSCQANLEASYAELDIAKKQLSYTVIKSPVDGIIGFFNYHLGSLVGGIGGKSLTTVSEIKEMYVYFNVDENTYLEINRLLKGMSIDEKLSHLPPVELVLINDSVYPIKGKVVTGGRAFDPSTGSIQFRADFKNNGLLRPGGFAKIRITGLIRNAMIIPQSAVYNVLDVQYVFVVNDSNIVHSQIISVKGSVGDKFVIRDGLKDGERIVTEGVGTLHDGSEIKPKEISLTK